MKLFLALRLAFAGVLKDHVTSLAVIAILALGLAAPTTFFSILWGGGLRPLPVPEGDRVMRVQVLDARGAGQSAPVSFREVGLLEGAPGVQSVGAFRTAPLALSTPDLGTLPVSGAVMTPATFGVLRVAPLVGRIPERAEVPDALILGYDAWVRHFDADPSVLGTFVMVDGSTRVVVAVMPEGFKFPFRQSAWLLADPDAPPEGDGVEAVLRLAGGVAPGTLDGPLTARWRQNDEARPLDAREAVLRVRLFTRGWGESGEGWAYLGLVLVGLCLLIIACVNASNLLLVRALGRMRTLGVQSALGASRAHLASQLFLEALLLAAAGGVGGLLLAEYLLTYVQRVMGPENFGFYWMDVSIGGPVVAFTGILVLGTALVAGTVPVVRVLRTDLQQVLKAGSCPVLKGPFKGLTWGRVFVTGQLALSCFALVAAGLTAGAMRTAGRFGTGLPSDEILVANYDLPAENGAGVESTQESLAALQSALAEIPGSRETALALGAPGYFEPRSGVELTGTASLGLDAGERVFSNAVTPAFFAALDLDVVRGRLLRSSDAQGAAPVAVVTRSLAARLAPGADPLGMAVRVPVLDSIRFYQVVGVVEDPGLGAGRLASEEGVYLPLAQVPAASGLLVVRGEVTPLLARDARRAATGAIPGLVLGEVQTLENRHRFMTRAQSTLSLLAVTGGLAGLLVAGAGLYALLAFRVRRSRREMGIRLALGADGRRLARDVVTTALGQLVPALVVGLALAWLAAPLLGILLLGGDPRSPLAYTVVAAVYLATGILAALVPALRAAGLNPGRVLSEE
jgi:predicted permease